MKAVAEKIEKNRVQLKIEVDVDEVEQALQRAYKKVVKQVNIPGFRKGKAPRKIVENYVGKEVLYNEAVDMMVPNAYYDAVKETAIEPIDQPQVELVQMKEGQPLIFTATVDVKPEVKLGQYKGVPVQKKEAVVTNKDVDEYLKAMQERYAKLVTVEQGSVEQGNVAVIDFEGFIDGQPFEGGKRENYPLHVGSGTFIPGFEDQLVGLGSGEEKELHVTFPEDYSQESLAGKEAVFKVTVKEIKRKELSPLDDEFAKDVSEFDTLQELRTDVENKLKDTREKFILQEMKNEVVKKVSQAAEVEIPPVLIERRIDSMVNDFRRKLAQQGLSLEKYLDHTQTSMEDLRKQYRDQAEQSVKTDLVLEAVAKAEGIEATEEEVEAEVEKMAKAYGQKPEQVKAVLGAQDNLEALKYSVTMDKTINFLLDSAEKVAPETQEKEETEERTQTGEKEES